MLEVRFIFDIGISLARLLPTVVKKVLKAFAISMGFVTSCPSCFTLLTLAVPRGLRDESSLISRHVDLGSFLAASMREVKYSRLFDKLVYIITSNFILRPDLLVVSSIKLGFLKCLFYAFFYQN